MKQIQSNEAIDEEGLSYLSRKQNSTLELRSNHHGHASVSHSAMSLKYPGYAKIGSVQIHESFIDTTMQPSFHDIITSTPLPCHKIRSRQTQLPAFCVKNIATGKAVHNPMKLKEGIFDEKYVSEEELFSSDDEDPDWKFENDSDNLTDESEDEVPALNDLSIYEYFQKYRTVDEIDSDVPASDECLAKMSSIQTVNSACESEPGAISTRHDYAKRLLL
ncbi:uncharacterized protein LOC134213633 [Armigeres subalbatus]|uniref:uncharacterized protein LOC134213633 n=1 Tax=Armigeres subalbatus TaxID=124917 RepID=UPI002ED0A835